jgi:uncharacterized protein (DUF1330 family)
LCATARRLRAFQLSRQSKEKAMNRSIGLGLAMLASFGLGAVAVNELNAQTKAPGAYAVIDISEITDSDTFVKQLLPKATPPVTAFGGQFIIRTENLVAINGTPPKRFVVIAFDSMEKAKAWENSPAQKEIDALRAKSTKSRAFIADGTIN